MKATRDPESPPPPPTHTLTHTHTHTHSHTHSLTHTHTRTRTHEHTHTHTHTNTQGLTATSDGEKTAVLDMLLTSTGGTNRMHESFDANNPRRFTRKWFAWANALFAEFVREFTDECR